MPSNTLPKLELWLVARYINSMMIKKSILPNAVYGFKEAAEVLGITTWGLRPVIKAGLLKPTVIGTKYRFLGSELIGYIKNNKKG